LYSQTFKNLSTKGLAEAGCPAPSPPPRGGGAPRPLGGAAGAVPRPGGRGGPGYRPLAALRTRPMNFTLLRQNRPRREGCRRLRYSHSVLVLTKKDGARRKLPESTSKEPPTPMNTPFWNFW